MFSGKLTSKMKRGIGVQYWNVNGINVNKMIFMQYLISKSEMSKCQHCVGMCLVLIFFVLILLVLIFLVLIFFGVDLFGVDLFWC